MQDNSFQKYATNYPDIFVDLTDKGIDYTQFSEAKVAYSCLLYTSMVSMGSLPVILRAFATKSSALPKRLSILLAASENMVCISAPSSASFCNSSNTFLYVQKEPVKSTPTLDVYKRQPSGF